MTVVGRGEVRRNGQRIGDVTMSLSIRIDMDQDPEEVADKVMRRMRHVEDRGNYSDTGTDSPAFVAAIVEDEDGSKRTYAQSADKIVEGIVVDRSVGPALLEEGE